MQEGKLNEAQIKAVKKALNGLIDSMFNHAREGIVCSPPQLEIREVSNDNIPQLKLELERLRAATKEATVELGTLRKAVPKAVTEEFHKNNMLMFSTDTLSSLQTVDNKSASSTSTSTSPSSSSSLQQQQQQQQQPVLEAAQVERLASMRGLVQGLLHELSQQLEGHVEAATGVALHLKNKR